ncbi:hypothetical protein M501DRAFT_940131 [Patellaria atrata CBS 101060]|uniref:HCP-like protein n=1 Tax=Patellaria atrata CBS 101060 TaxID=1346257 RepID=A0A9P4S6P0_9PEZI|nr:hypothetical protein M501DRAFT_940131 [Patellaria atrata CBS 101060]
MASRPDYLDLKPNAFEPRQPWTASGDLPSPRTGEIPPALSPLDAFALQGRLLAKKFEEKKKDGRRISRLPTVEIANELAKARPGYLRSLSVESGSAIDEDAPEMLEEDRTAHNAEEVQPDFRHRSIYPQFGSSEYSSYRDSQLPFRNILSSVEERDPSPQPAEDYFGIPRASSPDQMELRVSDTTPVTAQPTQNRERSRPAPLERQRTLTIDSVSSRSGLAPPRSPIPPSRPSPSIRSVSDDNGDDVGGFSLGGSVDSLPPRRFPSGASISRSHSPCSPFQHPTPRSPSMSSEYSVGGSNLPRPAFNFSRPLSRASQSNISIRPSGSGDSVPMASSCHYESVHTPVSMNSEEYLSSSENPTVPAPSYIYSKYDLPRGRTLQRDDSVSSDEFSSPQFSPKVLTPRTLESRNPPIRINRPATPPSPPHLTPTWPRPRTAGSTTPQRSFSDHKTYQRPKSAHKSTPSSPSVVSDASTVKARLNQMKPSSAEITPEQHLERGIECHEQGSLQESTYHLRIAARAGLPTAMLLYALACRHGWGMRPNPTEGVQWLKQAVDYAQSEVADDENSTRSGKAFDMLEQKSHKAQFALGVYELGQSYMNGWGTQQDKPLALRCFEIAGDLGDTDALAEAGFCYTEGVGCKKDLRKAARLYRAAAERGMSMAGNSWIYKEKYMDHEDNGRGRTSKKSTPEKKPRDKSRTRTIFGRKK